MVQHIAQRRLLTAGLIALVLLVCSVLIMNQTATVGASQEPLITLVPDGEANTGALITVNVVARNVQNLAGFQGTVRFDQANLRLTGASVDTGLGRDGRGVLPLGPVMRDGSVVLGAATCAFSDCTNTNPQPAAQTTTGVNGDVVLGTLEFVSGTEGSYTLSLDSVQAVDPQGNRLTVRAEPMVLEVRSQ